MKTLTVKTFTFDDVESSDTIGSIKDKIHDTKDIPADQQRLKFHNTHQFEDVKTLSECNIQNESVLYLIPRLGGGKCRCMPIIFVERLSGKTITLNEISPSSHTIADVKVKIAEQEAIPIIDQNLIFAGHPLEDGKILSE